MGTALEHAVDRLRDLTMWPWYVLAIVAIWLAGEVLTERARAEDYRELTWACIYATRQHVEQIEARADSLGWRLNAATGWAQAQAIQVQEVR